MYDLLKGVRVVEGVAFVAGPSCGLYLSQMGAEVIRFDAIGGGPDFNRWPLAPSGRSLYWEGLNKGKKSIALDLGRPEGRELAQRLATAPGDNGGLFVTNFPVDGFLSYEALKKLREDLICVRIMGWADGGPAVDFTVNAAVGIPLMTGPEDAPGPVNHMLPAWDLLTGAYAAFALLSALIARRADGLGREVRAPLSDIAATSVANLGMVGETVVNGHQRERCGNDLYGAFGRDFVTADGQRIMLVAITPRQWNGILEVLGIADAVAAVEAELGVSFAKHEGVRFIHRARLNPLFAAAFARKPLAELAPVFDKLGVCWGPYQPLETALSDPRLFAGNPVFQTLDHPSGERYLAPGPAATIPQASRGPVRPAPRIGQDTEEVLADLLGMSAGEIARLHDQGLVASA